MRQLRLVHLTEDGSSLLVETFDGVERFALAIDPVLRAAVQATVSSAATPAPRAVTAAPPARTSAPADDTAEKLGPREIQMRVRAGESPEQLAHATGMHIDSVLRFAAPVVAERARIADEARRARARRTTNESQVVVFGEAVDSRFEAHGIHAETVGWDSRRREDGEWVVFATWHGGNDTHVAEWLFHRTSRMVTPADETAVDLLSDAPIRPVVAAQPPTNGWHKLREAPPLVPGVVSFPPMPDAYTGPVPVVEEVFDQEADPDGPRDVPPLVADERTDVHTDVPLPLTLTGEPMPAHAGRDQHTDAERAERSKIPSWDDILLGVRRKSD